MNRLAYKIRKRKYRERMDREWIVLLLCAAGIAFALAMGWVRAGASLNEGSCLFSTGRAIEVGEIRRTDDGLEVCVRK